MQTLPLKNSMLAEQPLSFDFIDHFEISLQRNDVESWEPVAAFFQCSPAWVTALFKMRNALVKKLGLKAELANLEKMQPPFKKGDKFGLFNLYEINQNESIMGEDDFHLDFRLSFQIDENNVLHGTTGVSYNNIFGKIYLFFVKPFHQLIVPYMLKKMAKLINEKSLSQHSQRSR